MRKRTQLLEHWRLMRPRQWTKNIFVLSPLFFSFAFLQWQSWWPSLVAVVCFIALSATVYIINDIKDRAEDRTHPRKKFRPLAAKTLTVRQATLHAMLLLTVSFFAALLFLPMKAVGVMVIYLLMQLAYSFHFKNFAIIDIVLIASGFVLRVLMGAAAIMVPVSPWIILCTFLLALFLGFGKRYHELSVRGYEATRQSLRGYSPSLLDRMISISCGAVLISYALYTVETARALEKNELVYTVAFVVFGLFRYLQTLYVRKGGGEPEIVLLKDKVFLLNGILWAGVTLYLLI